MTKMGKKNLEVSFPAGLINPEMMSRIIKVADSEGVEPEAWISDALTSFLRRRFNKSADYRPDELARARGLSRRTIDREIKLWEYGDASHPKHTAGLGPVRRLRRAVIIPAESVAAWDARNDF